MNHRSTQTDDWRSTIRRLLALAISGMTAYWSACAAQQRCSPIP
jgi:hypothetical protein